MTMRQARRLHRELYTLLYLPPEGEMRRVRRANYLPFRHWARGALAAEATSGKLERIVGSPP